MPELPSASSEVKGSNFSVDAVEDLLNTDDKPIADDKVVDDKGKKDDDKIELVEDEKEGVIDLKEKKEELEEKDDDDEKDEDDDDDEIELKEKEEIEIDAPPKKQILLKDFPDLFKKHPFLEKMLYRDKKYTELFGSFDDAQEVAGKVETVNRWETELLNGDSSNIIKTVKDTDSKAFDKLVDNYLPNLAKADKEAYYEVVGNVSKQLISEMIKEATDSKNDDLQEAAIIVNEFLFGTKKFTPPTKRVDPRSEKVDDTVAKEKEAFHKERFDTARGDIQTKVDNILRSTINEYIDPRSAMTPFIKKNAVKEALESVHESLRTDPGLKRNLDKLWKAAADDKFSPASLGRIQSAYLGRAKTSLPSVIKKIRAEALKDLTPRRQREKDEEIEEEKEETTPRKRGPVNAGQPSRQAPKGNKMEKGESVSDFFARD